MARDHRRLRVFQDAHRLTLDIYKQTREFPRDEWFGIRSQLRRAAVSVTTNLVEGNARRTTRDYLRFLHISRGSAGEVDYLLGLSLELGLFGSQGGAKLKNRAEAVIRQLESLLGSMEALAAAEK
jgi:four helix bundle protein